MWLQVLGLLSLLLNAAPTWAQDPSVVDASGRHVYFLHGGVDEIKGSYLFLIENKTTTEQDISLRVLLPEETVDWMPQEGIAPNELKPGPEGGLVLAKKIPPGETMVSMAFRVPATMGVAHLTFRPTLNIASLAIFAPTGDLGLGPSQAGMQYKEKSEFMGKPYDMLTRGDIQKGQGFAIRITGVEEGRSRLWFIGFACFAMILLAAGWLAWVGRPKDDGTPNVIADI